MIIIYQSKEMHELQWAKWNIYSVLYKMNLGNKFELYDTWVLLNASNDDLTKRKTRP